jgi:hypothetical protein
LISKQDEFRLFKIHGRRSGGIQSREVANFARNENHFDVCSEEAHTPKSIGLDFTKP